LKPVTVSVIILNYNGEKWLRRCLASIREQTHKVHEIIVVDNASRDGSVDMLRAEYPNIVLLCNTGNEGYAAANNKAARQAGGEFLFFLNNDLRIAPSCVASLVEAARKNEDAALFSCYFYSYDGSVDICNNKWMGIDLIGSPMPSDKLFYCDGAALCIRRDAFSALGGFDEDYFMFAEDIDLCWRSWIAGYKIVGVKDAVVFHEGGASAGGSIVRQAVHETSLFRRYHTERNTLCNLLKNYSALSLLLVVPVYLVVYVMQVIVFSCLGRFHVVREVYVRSVRDVCRHAKDLSGRRKKVQQGRKVSDAVIFKRINFTVAKAILFLRIGIPRVR